MKKISYILTFIISIFIMSNVKAAQIDATLTLDGENTYGNRLQVKVACNSGDVCQLKDVRWYYNTTSATTGGTEIESVKPTDEVVGSITTHNFYDSYIVDESLVGKYIYVVATVGDVDNSYEPKEVTLKTTDENNRTAKVSKYSGTFDASDFSIEPKVIDPQTVGSRLELQVKNDNVQFNKPDIKYYFYITNNDQAPTLSETEDGCALIKTSDKTGEGYYYANEDGVIEIDSDYYLAKGLEYVYVVRTTRPSETGKLYCDVATESIKVKKPDLPSLGNRFQFYLFNGNESQEDLSIGNTLSIFPLFPSTGTYGTHNVDIAIGVINDENIIRKFAAGQADAHQSLLEYAKNNNPEKVFNLNDRAYEASLDGFKSINGKYYYIYTKYTDELYRNIEDVVIAYGQYDFLSNEVDYGAYSDKSSKVDVENPQTGAFISVISISLLIVIGIVTLIITRRKKVLFNVK